MTTKNLLMQCVPKKMQKIIVNFPDPDLPPIHISDAWIEELRESQPELREEKQLRYQSEYDLSAYDAGILTEIQTSVHVV